MQFSLFLLLETLKLLVGRAPTALPAQESPEVPSVYTLLR